MNKIKTWLIYKILRETKNSSLNLIKYAANHIRHTIAKIIVITKDHYYDKKLGIETSGYYKFADDLSLNKDGVPYVATPYHLLEKMINYLKLNSDDVFIDFGSGKGRVIFFVAGQKVKKVTGLELHKELVNIAQVNLNNLKLKNTRVEIINDDAAIFDAKDGTVFFMFNPFGEKTIARVIGNIKDTLAANPRKIRIVYYSPAFSELLDKQDWLAPEGEIEDTGIFVWRNKS
jgi:precorrin-6B methylase 2